MTTVSSSSKSKYNFDQKRDETIKLTKQMIKNSKHGESYAKKEEEQRLEKERQKESERKQAEDELKIK